ncbi:protein of unknown function [Clostridium sp. DSM 8431]|uniref:DUF2828 family protein n=1 Tax=Clostridium sp. DSM 8431 TaxID=1761781 RepID=UPI0008E79CA7|nr:DUF2828 family protein [Clostridium sp. DSM 8431]SFU32054.1 protein of unknown function [Clostridium sp. DSM 8431]
MDLGFLNSLKEELINSDSKLFEDLEEYSLSEEAKEDCLINFYAKAGFLRYEKDEVIINTFMDAYNENPIQAMKLLFYLRDKEKGLGERRVFRVIIKHLGSMNSSYLASNIHLIPVYGRWDDLYSLFDTYLQGAAIGLIRKQISLDLKADVPSNMCKWLKSENASSKESKDLARKTRIAMDLSSKEYRNLLTLLRKRVNIVEQDMSSNNWKTIKYGNLNYNTIRRYKKAFIKHDKKRFLEYVKVLEEENIKKVKETKELYPYEIINGICNGRNNDERRKFIEKWNSIPDYNVENNGDTLVCTALTKKNIYNKNKEAVFSAGVSTALYLVDKNKDKFKNYILVNTPHPNLKRIKSEDLIDRINETAKACIAEEINIESMLDIVLYAAIKNGLNREKIPKRILFIFDSNCVLSNRNRKDIKERFLSDSEYKLIKTKWAKSGYEVPSLAFWRIDGENKNAKVLEDGKGFQYAFGYSDEIFKFFINGERVTSVSMLEDVINNDRYKQVVDAD